MLKRCAWFSVLAFAFLSGSGWGETVTLKQSGYWSAYIAKTATGRSLCGLGTTFSNGRQVYLKWFEGEQRLTFQIFKQGWAIPAGITSDVVFKFERSDPWTVKSVSTSGISNFLEFYVPNDKVREFTHDFTSSKIMVIEFPSGTESSWVVNLAGNSPALDTLVKCVETVAGPDDRSQPYAYSRATQPFSPTTSQPFSTATGQSRGPNAPPQSTDMPLWSKTDPAGGMPKQP